MTTKYEVRYAVHPEDYAAYDTQLLRENFLVPRIFVADEINLTYTFYDRFVVGGAMPVKRSLQLETIDEFKAAYFLERRELGVINVGGKGKVSVDGKSHDLDYKEALYVGRGARAVEFTSLDAAKPARFYLNSTPAHAAYPAKKVGEQDAEVVELGAPETSNQRTIRKLLINGLVQTCQLQMGMTELKPGSVWNTMPPHTHSRRMEVYFYFAVPEKQAVCHFMGPPDETRHLWVLNEQAVVSPSWSMHCGAGTSNYIFIWGMAGENLDYDDMDKHTPDQLGAR